MLLSLLRYPMGAIEAEDRLFMASFLMRFGGAGPVQLTVLELAERLRMPPRVVMQAVSKLSTAEAYLVVKKVSVGRGRPSRSFEVSPSILAFLGEYPGGSCPPVCEQIIKNLLSMYGGRELEKNCGGGRSNSIGFKRPPVREKSNRLSVSNRWLLVVLVSYADGLGVVRDLGMSTLRQLTGMGEVKLKSQLRRLVELGLIRSYVPGVSSAVFTDAKVSSIYFLNLSHPFLGLQSDGCAVLVLHRFGVDRREAVCANAPPVVEQYFQQLKAEVFNLLYLRLDGYVSFLLTSHWSGLMHPACPDLTQALQNMVSSDFQRPDGNSAGGMKISESNWAVVIEHFCWWVFERAKDIKGLLVRMPSGDFCGAPIALIPAPDQANDTRVTTLLMEHAPVPGVSCVVINYISPHVCELHGRESELATEDRYRFGLLTRQKASVGGNF
ncbi:hypothetical protein [Pseudomonas sp.]|uniref:hypothetical protein n=1 Tax=Pseudomonas sp. TaxID=306 RepID=UPI00257E20EB|nr:hypothetical protein [Pseudomonas sp.]